MQLLRFKEWVTLEDAAQYLGLVLTEEVTPADVLRLALDGHLTLSVRLVNPALGFWAALYSYENAPAKHCDSEHRRIVDAEGHGVLWREPTVWLAMPGSTFKTRGHIERWVKWPRFKTISGIWDVPPFGLAWIDAQNAYQALNGASRVEKENSSWANAPKKFAWGPILYDPSTDFYVTLFPAKDDKGNWLSPLGMGCPPNRPATALPEDSQWGIRASALQEFEKQIDREQTTDLPGAKEEYVSKHLALVNKAARQFWSTAEPQDPNTHPTNGEVIEWLRGNGMTQNQAEAAARIIRPEWGHKGRRPEE